MIGLRDITAADIETINAWRADRDVADGLLETFRYLNIETDQAWFEKYQLRRDREVRLAIRLDETSELIGVAYLLDIRPVSRNCELGLMIGNKEYWGRGIGTLAVRMTLEHAFVDLNMHRVYAHVQSSNEASIRMHEANGFVHEGLMREHAFKRGTWVDVLVLGITRAEWSARRVERTAAEE